MTRTRTLVEAAAAVEFLVEAADLFERAGHCCQTLTLYPEREQRVQVALIRDAARSLAQACRDLARELRDGDDSA